MALDLTRTALQVDGMASELSRREGDRQRKLATAMSTLATLDGDAYEDKRVRSRPTLAWAAPALPETPDAAYQAPPSPDDFRVAGVDGSHIDVNRHLPARCFLINIGATELTYGSRPDARLWSRPRLYAREEDLFVQDAMPPHRQQAIEGNLLGAVRAVEEMKALTEVVRGLPGDEPVLALLDGSLVLFGLQVYPQFVVRQLVHEGLVPALDELRSVSRRRPVALAAYTSLPRAADVVNGLRVVVCPYETAECEGFCGDIAAGRRPCDLDVGGLMDREIFDRLGAGERTGVFGSGSGFVQSNYGEHGVHFFYLNAGPEIGRVEVPTWVAEDEALLGLTHSLVLDQCRRGPGYPVALMESHEQAVVTASDRRYFVEMVENALYDQRMPVYTSEKERSKRLHWL